MYSLPKGPSLASDAPVLLWFRKDLRLDDNLALIKSAKSNRPVIPVYIESGEASPYSPLGAAQRWWLHHSLAALGAMLEKHGSRLVLRKGEPQTELLALAKESGAEVVAVNTIPDPKAEAEDQVVRESLQQHEIAFHAFEGALLHDPETLLTGGGTGFKVYTPFWRALTQHAPPAPPLGVPKEWRHPAHFPKNASLASFHLLPHKPDWAGAFHTLWTPGEAGAAKRLHDFAHGALAGYAVARDVPGVDGTSGLSPHLALGEISPRRIWQEIDRQQADRKGGPSGEDISRYLKELVWREFSYHLLHHFPDLAKTNWNTSFNDFEWQQNEAGFKAWCKGETGFPIVDAGMRQLWQHGWMHNRVRMIVGSFLIKDLLIDWRRGEEWFRDTLVDADPASNSASWQWVAGSGADASPFFRVFNPTLQGEKFDPDGAYIRRYVPELAGLPDSVIHKPSEASLSVLKAAGVTLGKTYPKPVVDHKMARDRALAALSALKGDGERGSKKSK